MGQWMGSEERSVRRRIAMLRVLLIVSRILSLYLQYALLFVASPVFLASVSVWTDMAQAHDGYAQMERGRDAAFAVLQAISSVRELQPVPRAL